jgi:exonuclease SbcC
MRLHSLHLWNLRSYQDATVEFGEGVNLFEGDIGSGKSTILLAIEFALFGLAEVASRSLLRHGEKEGGVELVFSVRDRRVKATRNLRRTSSGATVKGCSIEVDGRTQELSSNEMRQRVLEVLEYGERRNPRARLDIFTYSTFTPQEDMRTVLAVDTKMHNQRKETLRRALDIEEYSQAAANLDAVRLQLDRDADVLTGMARDLEELRGELAGAREELELENQRSLEAARDLERAVEDTKRSSVIRDETREVERRYRAALDASKEAEAELARADGQLKEAKVKLEGCLRSAEELEGVREKLDGHTTSLEGLEALERRHTEVMELRQELGKARTDMDRTVADLERAAAALQTAEGLESSLEGMDDPAEELRAMREEADSIQADKARMEHEVQGLAEDIEAIEAEDAELTSLEGEALCPRCRQPLTEEHLGNLLSENQRRRNDIRSRMREAAARTNRLSEELEAKRGLAEELEALAEERRRTLQEAGREAGGRADRSARVPSGPLPREGSGGPRGRPGPGPPL